MPKVTCSGCSRTLKVPDEFCGRKAKCPCGTTIAVPVFNTPPETTATVASPEETAITLNAKELLAALPETLPRVRSSVGYRLALMLVAGVMVLLPLLYVSLIFAAGYAVYWHYAETTWFASAFDQARGKAKVMVGLAYAAPAVVGGILILFMLKPLFRRRPKSEEGFLLDHKTQPLVFDYVNKLCDSLGAPRPQKIRIDDRVNASAGLLSPSSLLTNKLVLTIGLPLAEGLSLRQFSGVLAHEFGHFSQFWAMRCFWIIETVNEWFRQVTTERDHWDRKLDETASGLDLRLSWVLHIARLMVWIVRKILTVFRYVGLFFSRRLARQMEFDADQFEIGLAGAAEFAATFDRMSELSLGAQLAEKATTQFLREGSVPDNCAKFVLYQTGELPRELLNAYLDATRSESVPWTSTHPSQAERIAKAQQSEATGKFELDCPASVIFDDFTALCREFTRQTYRRADGRMPAMDELTSVDELIATQQERRARYAQACRVLLHSDITAARWFESDLTWDTDSTREDLVAEIKAARKLQQTHLPRTVEAGEGILDIERSFDEANVARIMFCFGEKRSKGMFPSLPASVISDETIDVHAKELNARKRILEADLEPFAQASAQRIHAALRLSIVLGGKTERIQLLWNAMQAMRPAVIMVPEFERRLTQMEWLFARLSRDSRPIVLEIAEIVRKATVDDFQQIYGLVAETPYPYKFPVPVEHASAALLRHFTDQKNIMAVYNDVERYRSGFWQLWRRLQGDIGQIVEAAEAKAGLAPIEL